jgi:hypothetical protein
VPPYASAAKGARRDGVPATADEPAAFVRQAVALNREPEGSTRTR